MAQAHYRFTLIRLSALAVAIAMSAGTYCVPGLLPTGKPTAGDGQAVQDAAAALAVARSPGPPYMYRETSFHTGLARLGESLSPQPGHLWTFAGVNVGIHSASKSSPVADDQRVYVGADSGHLYALDKLTGDLHWQWAAHASTNGIHATPADDEHRGYIAEYAGTLTALDKTTGDVVWESRLGDSIGASPVIVGDRIYVGVETRQPNGFLAIVDRQTGMELATSTRFGDHTHCTPTVDAQAQRVYIGSNHGDFLCLDADRGRMIWQFTVPEAEPPLFGREIKSTAALVEQRALFTAWDGRLHCLDAGNGAELWSFATGMRSMSSPAVDPAQRRVYFGSHDHYVYAVDLDTGEERWRFETGARVYSSPVIVPRADGLGNLVAIGSYDAHVYLLDGETGASVWQTAVRGAVTSVPLISDGRLYVSTNGGDLVCWE